MIKIQIFADVLYTMKMLFYVFEDKDDYNIKRREITEYLDRMKTARFGSI